MFQVVSIEGKGCGIVASKFIKRVDERRMNSLLPLSKQRNLSPARKSLEESLAKHQKLFSTNCKKPVGMFCLERFIFTTKFHLG
mgnify:CR=1 FL=1